MLVGPDGAAVQLDDPAGDGQPQAGTGPAGRDPGPVETVEDAGKLVRRDAVALRPADWAPGAGVVELPLAQDVTLPLIVLWPAGAIPPAVARVREGMATSA